MRIELQNSVVRAWQIGDEAALAGNANNRRVSQFLRDSFPYPYTLEDANEWIAAVCGQVPVRQFAIEVDGFAAGGIGLVPFTDVYRNTAELGYWLGEPFWGRGILSEAVPAVTEYGFSQLNLRRIQAGVYDRNPASARVLEKAGFQLEGRLRSHVTKEGEVMDELVYGKVRA